MGKVENGLIVKNMRCFIMPDCIKAEVQEIFGPEDIKYMYAGPGENVKVKLKLPEGAEILRGYVVSDIHAKLPTAMEFYVDL